METSQSAETDEEGMAVAVAVAARSKLASNGIAAFIPRRSSLLASDAATPKTECEVTSDIGESIGDADEVVRSSGQEHGRIGGGLTASVSSSVAVTAAPASDCVAASIKVTDL